MAHQISTVNSSACVTLTAENSLGYLLFSLYLIPAYMNNQLHYYHVSGAMLSADKAKLKKQMEEHKNVLELVNWDGNTQENISVGCSSTLASPPPVPYMLLFDNDNEPDSSCPELILGQKDIKFSLSDITKLQYDSNVAQFNN